MSNTDSNDKISVKWGDDHNTRVCGCKKIRANLSGRIHIRHIDGHAGFESTDDRNLVVIGVDIQIGDAG